MRPGRFLLATLTMLMASAVPIPSGEAHTCIGWEGDCGPCPYYYYEYHEHVEVDASTVPPTVTRCRSVYSSCYPEYIHRYVAGGMASSDAASVAIPDFRAGGVLVANMNDRDCNWDGIAFDWDGDYEVGVGGGFFGWGAWADEPICNYWLNVHGREVAVNDVVYGSSITFVVAENDRDGPTKIWNPATQSYVCETDGTIRPGDPAENPAADPDDCVSEVFVGVGATCGEGGGDGGYWVVLIGAAVGEGDSANPPTTGTITAF